ncbi:MAG: hypothetical protein D6695_12510 [Planctomycetota bacterium]|nr:MAG: hypothetical protein D6695_12510 [Planctomycetota bacterium]
MFNNLPNAATLKNLSTNLSQKVCARVIILYIGSRLNIVPNQIRLGSAGICSFLEKGEKMQAKKMCFGLVAAAALTAGAQADDLLIVDLSVVNQVTISATTGNSAADASGSDSIGVYLADFYSGPGNTLAETFITGNLTNAENPSDLSPNLFRGGSGTDTGLNIWSFSSDSTVTFTAGSLAFVGSATWALSAAEYSDMLNGNSSGTIYFPADTFDDIPSAVALGTYRVVVPSPGALSLIGLGLGAGAIRRRR